MNIIDRSDKIYTSFLKNKTLAIICVLLAIIAAIRWFYFIDKYSVNMLMSDQIGFYSAFVNNWSLWDTFNMQFGPQRQGIGLVLTGLIDGLSGWNTRWTSFAIGVFIFLAATVYLLLRRKINGKLDAFDVFIPILLLSPVQFGIFTVTPFMSHSAVPALLLPLFLLALFIRPLLLRNIVLLIINFNLVYSSFGFFMGVITPMLFIYEMVFERKMQNRKALVINGFSVLFVILTFVLFFTGYRANYISATVEFTAPWRYIWFIALGYSAVFGAKGIGIIQTVFGLLFLLLVLWVFALSLKRILYQNKDQYITSTRSHKIIVILIAYSLIFLVNTALGRISLGIGYAQAPRYFPYVVPSVIGVYCFFKISEFKSRAFFILLLFALMMAYQFVSYYDVQLMKKWADAKSQWKETYLKHESVSRANSVVWFTIYPDSNLVKSRFDFLKEHKLNIYLDR